MDLPAALPKATRFLPQRDGKLGKASSISQSFEAMIRLIEALCVWQYGRKEVWDTSVKLTFIASCSPLCKKPLETVSSAYAYLTRIKPVLYC